MSIGRRGFLKRIGTAALIFAAAAPAWLPMVLIALLAMARLT